MEIPIMRKFHFMSTGMLRPIGCLTWPSTIEAMKANILSINTAMARLSNSLTSLGTLPATLLPEDFSLPVIPPLKGSETDPANWTDEDLGTKPRRIGFNREDEESEKE